MEFDTAEICYSQAQSSWIWWNQSRQIIQERIQWPAETPFQLFYGQDMKQRCLGQEGLRINSRELKAKIKPCFTIVGASPAADRAPTLLSVFICVHPWFQPGYCAAKARSALPAVPAVNTYPEPTNTMPPATVGPGAAIEPPLAGT
jgi:hypothetical protein